MKKLLKFFLTPKFKTQKLSHNKGGFTLIELLVGLIMGALIITPLLGFVINVMSSDRQEQAKSNSEQEIQTALDYISRDVSQAIFIYDGFGLNQISAKLPNPPAGTEGAPVLVFWKREIKPKVLANNDDAYTLSLVAYYLIKDTTCSGNSAWSCTTRIGRVQLDDAVPDGTPPIAASPGFSTPFSTAAIAAAAAGPAKTFEERMNAWTPTGAGNINDNQVYTLIDYVDQSPVTPAGLTASLCPTDPRLDLVTSTQPAIPYTSRQVPDYNGNNIPASLKTGSFYACVNVATDTTPPLAQVFIRGNSKARISPKNNPPTYSQGQTAYFPKASVQVQGRGLINPN